MSLGYQGAEGCPTKEKQACTSSRCDKRKVVLWFSYTGDWKGTPGEIQPWSALSHCRLYLTLEQAECRKSLPVTKGMLPGVPSFFFSKLNKLRKPKGSVRGALPTTSGVYTSHQNLEISRAD